MLLLVEAAVALWLLLNLAVVVFSVVASLRNEAAVHAAAERLVAEAERYVKANDDRVAPRADARRRA